MQPLREEHLVGLDALAAATELLQRVRGAHPTAGLYEAADLQWWWRAARSNDDVAQLVWFDHLGRPEAAAILTDWGSRVAVDTFVLPDAPHELVAQVFERGLAHAAAYGLFWFDPVTATGLVEPMRTSDDHQRRGLARHVLTTGVSRLAEAGARRVKVCNEPDNPAADGLYRSVGFEPMRQTDLFMRRTVA